MQIIEAADYILGRKFMEGKKEPFRGDVDTLALGKKMLARHHSAARNLQLLDVHSAFYKMEPDMAHEIPKEMREEVFYSLKLDYLSPILPAKAIFLITKCYDRYGSLNLIPKVVPESNLAEMFTEGYVAEGYSLRDAICSLFDELYKPLNVGDLAVPNRDNWDVYIEDTDMVAIVPQPIKDKLSNDDIKRLKVVGKDIVLGDTPIRYLSNYIGAVNSTYDLSTIV
jgi:hypothetical protein